ncbi:uncharacterized protein PADG_11467 [Paracoccidioides brasiliensis Pb18]|uniref:Uncharacterized protein n=1 Tax=Paracoccidioides brasiliensis (strain Pb18) TaxID=502780 RepID=A0A0A0HSW6_PARBD|nr:uncharacterized protein PADG_11467 [Paracoccidioides brasiliensis Pb18]KGM92279.1 hypothetical protein PADG_11467 [Paracoccidioides brasiliensis Pb18]
MTLSIRWVPLTSPCPGASCGFTADPDPPLRVRPRMPDCDGVKEGRVQGDEEWELIDRCYVFRGPASRSQRHRDGRKVTGSLASVREGTHGLCEWSLLQYSQNTELKMDRPGCKRRQRLLQGIYSHNAPM